MTPATLYVIATPIGNLEDLSHRAVRVLGEVDALACEDTRHTARLLQHYGIKRPEHVFSCHGHNERSAARRAVSFLEDGKSVALVSDAGAPGINDPGLMLIEAVLEAGFEVDVIPGASAVTTALLMAGFPGNQFTFLGFTPQRKARRRRQIEAAGALPGPIVFFESPRRIAALLAELHEILGPRQAAVCLELTKTFQRVERGGVLELSERFADAETKGEITLVVEGTKSAEKAGDDEAEESQGPAGLVIPPPNPTVAPRGKPPKPRRGKGKSRR